MAQATIAEATTARSEGDAAPAEQVRGLTADALARVQAAMAGFKPGARIVVAMSGGVDSSAAAALLKSAGFDVIGVTMQLYDHGMAVGKTGSCCAGQDIHDARQVADMLDIPHYVLDYEKRFRDKVIAPFIDAYRAGETPIPCAACNSDLKFGELLEMAKSLGAVALATGHYVQRADVDGRPTLRRARDVVRDQSYFLFGTTPDQLSKLAFPIGGFEKAEVRALASALGVPVAGKPDSQDICFVPKGNYADMIEKLHPGTAEPGEIVHVDGRVLGTHAGIIHFTVGQRKGLGIAAAEPLFVLRLDVGLRRVIVGPRSKLGVDRIHLRDVNWLGERDGTGSEEGMAIWVRLRSSQALRRAVLSRSETATSVLLAEPEHGISAGQGCVFYESDAPESRILGGGWIARSALESGAV